MGNLIDWIKTLDVFVISRRATKHSISQSVPDHPERVPSNDLRMTNTTDQSTTATSIELSTHCSDFYWACRNNNIQEVKQLLETMTLEEIDRMEPNGSTALHAACFHGHQEIVMLLLEAGADRAVSNKYQCLPFDEAKNDDIKQVFFRIPACNRFISNTGAIEWELIDDDVSEKAEEDRDIIKSIYAKSSPTKMFERIEKNFINKELKYFHGIGNIKRFFRKATEEQDPIWIIKAYTAETDFYKILNTDMASGVGHCENERRYIIALLLFHPRLDQFSYTGPSYRAMQVNETSVQRYQLNSTLMIKSFVSSSIDREIALWLLGRHELARHNSGEKDRFSADGKVIKQWVMCKYQIKHRRTALHVENSSQYANEGEILIMPYAVFQVKETKRTKLPNLPGDHMITEIELEECDQ